MTLRATILALLAAFVVGAALLAWGTQLAPYTDVAAADRLKIVLQATDTGCDVGDHWYDDVDALRTARNPLMDGGSALMLIAASLMILVLAAVWRGATRLTEVGTPRYRATFFFAGSLATLWFHAGLAYSFVIDLDRDAFPVCADSIIIPIYGLAIGCAVLLPILLVVGLAISLLFGRLPVSLAIWDRGRPIRTWIWTVLAALACIGLVLLIFFSFLTAQFLIIPSCLVGVYLVLSTRAAVLAPRDTAA